MNRIQEIQNEITKLEKLSEIGIEIYNSNNDLDFLHDAVFHSSKAGKLKRVLKEEYGVIL